MTAAAEPPDEPEYGVTRQQLRSIGDAFIRHMEELAAENIRGWVDWGEDFWNPPPVKEFIPGMLIENQVGTIYSAGGQGKSLLALDIVVGLTHRGEVFGVEVERQPVLYLDRENSKRGLAKRLRAMGYDGAELPDLYYSLLGDWPPLDTAEGGEVLAAEVERTGARLVVIDTMSKVIAGEENANPTWSAVHAQTMVRLKRLGVTVLQLDHTGKDSDRGQRGGSGKHDNADVVWHLTASGSTVKLVNKKDREDDYEDVIYLQRAERPLRHVRTAAPSAEDTATAVLVERVATIVEMLDGLGVDPAWGRGRQREALNDGYPGFKVSTGDLIAAMAARRS